MHCNSQEEGGDLEIARTVAVEEKIGESPIAHRRRRRGWLVRSVVICFAVVESLYSQFGRITVVELRSP